MNALLALYRQHLQARHLSPLTIEHRLLAIERFLAHLQSESDLRDVTFQQLADYHASLGRRRNQQGELITLGYQHSQVHAVTHFYAFLKTRGRIVLDPFENFPKLRKPHRLPRGVITNAQVMRLLQQPNEQTPLGFRERTLMEVLYSTGLRGGEVCQLAVYDIDLKERTVRVNQGKGKKDRFVPIGKVAAEYVREYLAQVRPVILARNKGRGSVERLFLSNHGTPLHAQTLWRILRRHRDAAHLPRSVTTHSLRHACATEMLRGGASVRHVQEMLGHAHLSTTQIYTRVVPSDLQRVHKATSPSERRRRIDVPAFELRGWKDKKNSARVKRR